MKNFLDYLRENSTLDLSDEVDKDLSIGDVHVPAAGGDGKKRKKKTAETLARVFEQKTFDEAGSEQRAFEYWVEKAKQASGTRTVMLMRHGATHLNNNDTSVDRIRGWKNVPLSPEGKDEAAKLAEKVAKDPPDSLFSSDLKRAADTAQMVAAASDLKFGKAQKLEGLRPWNVGKFAGQSSKQAVPVLCDYAIKRPDEAIPEGESFNDFYNRFTKCLAQTLKDNPGTVGIVTHHRNERVLTASAKAGWKPGVIDGKEFTKKGEGTAGFEEIEIPQKWLDSVGGGAVAKFENVAPFVWEEGDNTVAHEEVGKSFELNIAKIDTDQQIFYGWAYVSEENGQIVVDKQDDYIVPSDLLKAAEEFTLHGGKLGDMHDARNVGRVVASFCTTGELCKAFGLSVQDNRVGWILGFKVDDPEVWQKIKSGGQLELSIGGRGERVEWETPEGQPHVREKSLRGSDPVQVADKSGDSVHAPAPPVVKVLPLPPVEQPPINVNVTVPPAKHKTIKMRRDADGNLIAEVTES